MKGDEAWKVFGLGFDAGPAEIRARYLELVKRFPPDRAGERFSRIREAYEILMDPEERVRVRFFEPRAFRNLEELEFLLMREGRRPAGAEAWIEALRELKKAEKGA